MSCRHDLGLARPRVNDPHRSLRHAREPRLVESLTPFDHVDRADNRRTATPAGRERMLYGY